MGLRDAELAALLGALSLNTRLTELDLCANPAPRGMVVLQALGDALPRAHAILRHHRALAELPGVVRAAPSLAMALMRGVALPGWLAPHAAEGRAERDEYCLHVQVPACATQLVRTPPRPTISVVDVA